MPRRSRSYRSAPTPGAGCVPSQTPNRADRRAGGQDDWENDRSSDGHILNVGLPVDPDAADEHVKKIIKEGAMKVNYAFQADRDAEYVLWARTGPAAVYSPSRWQLDDNEWTNITHENPFLDQYDISFFFTLGWVRLGSAKIAEGEHVLHVEVPKPLRKEDRPETDFEKAEGDDRPDDPEEGEAPGRNAEREDDGPRWVMTFDCFAISRVPFHPNGKLKLGERVDRFPWLDKPSQWTFLDFSSLVLADGGKRDRFDLDGLWEMARDQEPVPSPVKDDEEKLRGPLTELPPDCRAPKTTGSTSPTPAMARFGSTGGARSRYTRSWCGRTVTTSGWKRSRSPWGTTPRIP